jgi:hypothetical protein
MSMISLSPMAHKINTEQPIIEFNESQPTTEFITERESQYLTHFLDPTVHQTNN